MEVKFDDGPVRLKIEGVAIRAHPSDPMGQRSYLCLKFEGGITAMHTEQPPDQRDAARVDFDACLRLCEEIHARCFSELQRVVTEGRSSGNGPKSAAGALKDRIYKVEQERDKAIRRAEEAETRLDELRRVVGPPPRDYVGGPLLDASTLVKGSGGGDNGTSDREV